MSRLAAISPASRSTPAIRALIAALAVFTAAACAGDDPTAPTASKLSPSDATRALVAFCPRGSRAELSAKIVSAGASSTPSATPGTKLVNVWGTVTNSGVCDAEPFRVEASQATADPNGLAAYFKVNETAQIDAHGSLKAPLAPGATVAFTGTMTVTIPYGNNPGVWVMLVADGCINVGDEFFPTYCRVYESNESNNLSNRVWIP